MKFSLDYSPDEVLKSLRNNLALNGNPAIYHFQARDRLWLLLEKALKDKNFMTIVIFNNDYLKIAPVHTFSSYFIDNKVELSMFEKNSVGRIFKFIFEILGYNDAHRIYRSNSSIQYGKIFIRK